MRPRPLHGGNEGSILPYPRHEATPVSHGRGHQVRPRPLIWAWSHGEATSPRHCHARGFTAAPPLSPHIAGTPAGSRKTRAYWKLLLPSPEVPCPRGHAPRRLVPGTSALNNALHYRSHT
ncbi:hypothetical protein GDO78_010801 [Eleutherodactylus coqui]|uniref:Uncharacterized protein n=1 Tax=Eleutherodactylus coqui TaxID=57060 RepID=A0A8J6F584_ELECQ|nr:hypothetical protein GDO78_010801 [Eleutherodactylus coqui]